MSSESLVYLYGIVPADAPPPPRELRGVEGGAVGLLRAGEVAGLVGEVPAAEYGEEVLDARISDLGWVGERGVAHDRVLTWYSDRGPVLPLAPFSLHRDRGRAAERLSADAERFRELLGRVRGRQEWGIRLWRETAAARERLGELSPSVRAIEEEMESAAPGRRFLLAKKLEVSRDDALHEATDRVARELVAALRPHAEAVAILPSAAPREERVLALHAAFLVPQGDYPAFQEAVTAAAHRYRPLGFDLEFTGPWPPYHFAKADAR